MPLVLRSLVLALVVALVTPATVVNRGSSGTGGSPIIFASRRRGDGVFGSPQAGGGGFGNSQAGETSATSVQTSSGEGGQQTNQGQATAVSLQQQDTGPGGNRQVINNQAVIQALQQANGTDGTVQQSSNNQVNIVSNQLQQNVNGTLVNVQSGPEGVVIINANDLSADGVPGSASVDMTGDALVSLEQQDGLSNASQVTNNQGIIQALQQAGGAGSAGGEQLSNNQVNVQSNQQQENVNGTLVHVQEGHRGVVIINTNDETGAVVNQTVINDKPIEEETEDSARCRYICLRPVNREIYCCDDGSNEDLGTSNFHEGDCLQQSAVCVEDMVFRKCAYDSQCPESDRCCYDECANHHVCQPAVIIH